MTTDYAKRLRIPIHGDPIISFRTNVGLVGLVIAKGFVRVVIGQRGPYVEFGREHVHFGHLERVNELHWYFAEWRTLDGVKVYEQRRRVVYANYEPGRFYISPFHLRFVGGDCIDPLSREQEQGSFAWEGPA